MRSQAMFLMVGVAILAGALAVTGLAIGIAPVPRRTELVLFGTATGAVLGALWLVLVLLLRQTFPSERIGMEVRARRAEADRRRAKVAAALLVFALAAGLAVAAVRSDDGGATAPPTGGAPTRALDDAIEQLRQSPDSRKRALGDDLRSLTGALAGAGIALSPAALRLLAGRARNVARTAKLGAGGALGVLRALARGIRGSVVLRPGVSLVPTVRIDRPAVFSLDVRLARAGPRGRRGPPGKRGCSEEDALPETR